MKRLGEKNLTAGRERWFAAALVLTYAFLYLQYMNVLWVRLTAVYYPWVVILLLIALLPRYKSEKIELRLMLLFAAWMFLTRVLRWDVKAYIENWRAYGPAFPEDTASIVHALVIYPTLAACLILRGRNRERLLDGIAMVAAAFSTLTTSFCLYAVLNKTDIPIPHTKWYLCVFGNYRLWILGKNPNIGCTWYFLGIVFLAYLFCRTKNRFSRGVIVLAGLLNYVVLAMTFSRSAMLAFSLCTGLLVLVLVLRRFSPKTVGKKLVCTVLVLGLIVPLAYKSFSLTTRGVDMLSTVLLQSRSTPETEELGGEETPAAAPAAYRFNAANPETAALSPVPVQLRGASPALLAADGEEEKSSDGKDITYEDDRGFRDSGRFSIYKTIIPTMQREPLRLLIGCLEGDVMKYSNEIRGKEQPHFHDVFLQVLCLTGVAGLLLVLAFCVLLGRRVIRVIYSGAPMTVSVLALMCVGVFAYNIVEIGLFTTSNVASIAAYIAAGAVLAYTYEQEESRKNPE